MKNIRNTPGKNKQENLACKLTVSTFENTQTLVPHNMQNTFMHHFILENMADMIMMMTIMLMMMAIMDSCVSYENRNWH